MAKKEVWKDVVGYEGLYQVSNFGRVKSLDRIVKHSKDHTRIQYGRIRKIHINKRDGYVYVGLHNKGEKKRYKVHRLVALAFIDNPLNKPEVNHLDECKANNNVENLEWVTRSENENWGTKTERKVHNTDYSIIAKKNSKKVIQYDINNNVIGEWNSLAEIYRVLGYSTGNISSCCTGKYKRPLYNCFWRYAEVD